MGKIKTKLIKRTARTLLQKGVKFNEDFDSNKKALRISIKAAPEKGKANQELVKFLSKLLKKKVMIIKGLKNREKILKID